MNKFLASTVAWMNAILAIFIVVAGVAAGGNAYGGEGAVLGAIAGIVVAVLICGLLALVVDIRNELVLIRNELRAQTGRAGGPA